MCGKLSLTTTAATTTYELWYKQSWWPICNRWQGFQKWYFCRSFTGIGEVGIVGPPAGSSVSWYKYRRNRASLSGRCVWTLRDSSSRYF